MGDENGGSCDFHFVGDDKHLFYQLLRSALTSVSFSTCVEEMALVVLLDASLLLSQRLFLRCDEYMRGEVENGSW